MSFELRHKLFNNLDNPTRFLFWTLPEAMVLLIPLFMGIGTGFALSGLVISCGGIYVMREWDRRMAKQNLQTFLYWYFPHNKAQLKVTPPSYIREYIG